MYVLIKESNFDDYNSKFMILSYDKNYDEVLKIYNSFQDLKVKIFMINDEKFKYYGLSMKLSDMYFNPGDFEETLVLEN